MPFSPESIGAAAVLLASAAVTVVLIRLLHPLLVRYAMARPNARSSHSVPTPQGAGIAVVAVVLAVLGGCAWLDLPGYRQAWAPVLAGSLVALAVVGALDDINPLPVLPRLILQLVVALLLVITLPQTGALLPFIPEMVQTMLLVLALVWFINLTNFMDGIDWMTIVEVVPTCAGLALMGGLGLVPQLASLLPLVLALAGAMIGFAPFNRHVATFFLGDVGSLPVGALVGWLLFVLAMAGHLVAAIILPLYYLADTTITLVRRYRNGERISQSHRSHFYQRAVAGGFKVPEVTRDVALLNSLLVALALVAVAVPRIGWQIGCLVIATTATLVLLLRFERGRRA